MQRFYLIIVFLIVGKGLYSQSVSFSSDDTYGCAPLISSFSTQNLTNATFISWDFGNGTIISGDPLSNPILINPTIAYIDEGIYTVVLTYTLDGTTANITRNDYINAYSVPSVAFVADNTYGCGNFTIAFTDESTAEFGTINEWHWDFGNGYESNQQNPSATYFSEGLYDVTLNVSTNYGCEATLIQDNFIIALEGPNTSFEVNSNFACDLPFELVVNNTTTSNNPLTYLWDFDNGQSTNIEQPGSIVYTEYGTYNINLNANDASTCDANFSQTLLIQPMYADFEISYGCTPTWITFYNNSTYGLTDFIWNYGDPNSGPDNTDSTYHAIHFYADAGIYPVTLIAQNDGGCSDSITIDMAISEAPFDIEVSEDFICELPTITNVSINTQGISAIEWVLYDSLGFPAFSGNTLDFVLEFDSTFISYDEQLYPLSLSIDYEDGCHKEIYIEDFITIVIPRLDAKIVNLYGCAPLAVSFIDSSSFPYGFSEIQWNLGNGDFEYGSEINYTYADTGVYFTSLSLTTPQGCQIDTFFVDPIGVGEITTPSFNYIADTICHGDPFTLVYNGPYYADSLYWTYSGFDILTPGNINELEIPAYSICGPIQIELTAFHHGCPGSISQVLDDLIREGPQPNFEINTQYICYEDGPLVFEAQNTSCSLTPNDSIFYQWFINGGDTSLYSTSVNPPSIDLEEPSLYIVYLQASSTLTNCTSAVVDTLLVDKLTVELEYNDTIGCNPFQIVESAFGNSISNLSSDFSWSFELEDTTLFYETVEWQTITPLIPDTGTYQVSIIGINEIGCSDTLIYDIRSSAPPIANFISPDSIECSPSTIQLLDSSYGENTIVHWDYLIYGWENDFDSIQHPYFDLNYPTPYAASLIVRDIYGCTSQPHTELLYPPLIFNEFVIPDAVCVGEEIHIANYSYGSGEPFTYYWDFGNGETSTEAEPIFQYDSVSVTSYFYLSVVISDVLGCSFTFEDSILVSVPIFDLTASLDSTITCPPVFTDIIPIGSGDMFSWEIAYGDGDTNTIYMDSTIASFSHVYEIPGYYDVTVTGTDTNQCTAVQYYDSLVLIAGPYADFTYTPNAGCPALDVEFSIINESGVSSLIWVFGDGGTDTIYNPTNTYLNAGTFYPVLVVQDSINWASGDTLPCVVTLIGEELTVDGPIVDFTVSDDTLCYGGGSVTFTNQTIAVDGFNITSWLWDFGDGSTSTLENPPEHEYTEPGAYIVSLQANTDMECTYFEEKFAVLVLDLPPLLSYAEYEIDCPAMPVQFYADTSIWLEGMNSIEWDFGDGDFSDEWFPLHFYQEYGSYQASVAYTIFSCTFNYLLNDSISTYPQPSAQYASYPLQNNEEIYGQLFENNSIGEVAVNWLLDSILISIENEIEVDFENTPLYLSLVAINEFGCTDTSLIELWKYYDDTTPNIFTPNGDGINDVFSFDLSDAIDCIAIKIFNRWGKLVFEDANYLNSWDGTDNNGKTLSDGTYFYIANLCDKTALKGYVTLIR